jgi:uncharacterized protein YfaQ (DUF2300 family)
MATQTLKAPEHVYSSSGGAPQMVKLTCTGATVVAGHFLVRTNNLGAVCADSCSNVQFLSPVANAATMPGAAALELNVIKIRPSDVFEINVWNTTASSAVIADSDLDAELSYGVAYVTVSGVAAWVLNSTNTTTEMATIIERLSPAADTYPRVRCQFKSNTTAQQPLFL